MHKEYRYNNINYVPDAQTEYCLLPEELRERDNSRRLKYCKKSLHMGLCYLTKNQREQMELYYREGLTKSGIARRQGISSSAVCKSIRAAESALREYTKLYMEIFVALERELLNEEELI